MIDKNTLRELVAAYPVHDTNRALTLLFLDHYADFWSTANTHGHVTASCWTLNTARDKCLLTHHRKLGRWFQLGGHVEAEDADIFSAAERELREESGFGEVKLLARRIYDIDVHKIPARKGIPEHFHFDLRIAFEVDEAQPMVFSEREAKEMRWVPLGEVAALTDSDSVVRMARGRV